MAQITVSHWGENAYLVKLKERGSWTEREGTPGSGDSVRRRGGVTGEAPSSCWNASRKSLFCQLLSCR